MSDSHEIFYYPYASFRDDQSSLLKAVAFYFDKVYILDPIKATSGGIRTGPLAKDLEVLEQEGLLERVAPERVLHDWEDEIADAIRADLGDPEFLSLFEAEGAQATWELSLAKVPETIRNDPEYQPLDRSMQTMLGARTKELAGERGELPGPYQEVFLGAAAHSEVYDEYREVSSDVVEYRWARYPLPIGESIMLNHALFAGLVGSEATPFTDDPFHSRALQAKIERVRRRPELRARIENRRHGMAADVLAMTTLRDHQLSLPAISADVPIEELLKLRSDHEDEFAQLRRRLANMARRVREEPWSEAFQDDLDHEVIPNIEEELAAVAQVQDSWVKSQRGRAARRTAAAGAAAVASAVALVTGVTPLVPAALALAGSGVPVIDSVQDMRSGPRKPEENALHYLLRAPA